MTCRFLDLAPTGTLRPVLGLALVGSLGLCLIEQAQAEIVPILTQRALNTFGSVSPIEGETEFDADNFNFDGLGSVDEELALDITLEDAAAQATCYQFSSIQADGNVAAFGGFEAASTLGSSATFAEALGASQLTFRFSVTTETPATMFGLINATGNGVANVVLVGPNGTVPVNLSTSNELVSVDESLLLVPGAYELSLSTSGFGQALPDGETPATGNFEIYLVPDSPASVEDPATITSAPVVAPNPVTRDAEIRFRGLVPEGRELFIVGANGRLVRSLGSVGASNIRWDTRDDEGALVPAGVYFVRLAGTGLSARTVVLR